MTFKKTESVRTEFTDKCRDLLSAARDSGCADSLNSLATELEAVTRRIAQGVVSGTRQAKEHFAGESLASIFAPDRVFEKFADKTAERPPRIFTFDPDVYVYELWCRTVLRNIWKSRHRKLNLEQTVPIFPSVEASIPIDYLQLSKPFSLDELLVIEAWPAVERLMLLCLSGLFVKLRKNELNVFVGAAEEALGLRFPRSFPTRQLLDEEEPSSRMSLVAELFHVKINTMSARWMRKKHLLRELSVVRDCEPDSISTID